MRHEGGKSGFVSESGIENQYVGAKGCFAKAKDLSRIQRLFKEYNEHPKIIPHHEAIDGQGGRYDCDHIVDKWIEWALTLPGKVNPIMLTGEGYGTGTDTENVHLL